MKVVVVLGEGMADEPIGELGGKTPLEYARTPHMDLLASRGILGLTRTIPRGMPPTADVGMLSVLGYDPANHRSGPAAFEAASIGVSLGPEDVAFRCDLVTLETPEGGVEVMRDFAAGHPPTAEARELIAALDREIGGGGLEFHCGLGYRHLLVWRGGEAGMRTVAPCELSEKPIAPAFPQGPGAATLCERMERSRAVLAHHPVCQAHRVRGERVPTAIWLWGQGRRVRLPTLHERFGVQGCVVAGVDLANGVGMLAGLRRIAVPGATGYFDTDYAAKTEHGLRALEETSFLLLHVAAPCEGGHMGDPQRKVEAIEKVDESVVGPLLEGLRRLGGEWRLFVASDRAVPCGTKTNSPEPVPFAVYTSRDDAKQRGMARAYNERDARDHGIFIAEAHGLMERLLRQ